MYLGKSLLPAAATYLTDALTRPPEADSPSVGNVDWTNKVAVIRWIREQSKWHSPFALLVNLPFASLPPELRADLDIGLAVADADPVALTRLSPSLLQDLEVARRAIAVDSASMRLFSDDVLRQLGPMLGDHTAALESPSELEMALVAVKECPLALGELSVAMRDNADVVSMAAAGDPTALAYASKRLWTDLCFMERHLTSSSCDVSRVLCRLVFVHGDAGAAQMLVNHNVTSVVALRVNLDTLPPKTREVVQRAHDARLQTRHSRALPRRPSPFSDS